jgi:glucosylceramidase
LFTYSYLLHDSFFQPGWMEWNLILDGIGGPNHLGNLCETTLLSVPHRAVDTTVDALPLPFFELQKPVGNASLGDGRTREELNALGFPARFLDLGIAVQPIYFYMGHISRYVRPGSKAVTALVHSASGSTGKIFLPQGQGVAGGGMNDLAREGIELTVWPCEGSTRQQFKWDDISRHILVYGHDWLGNPTVSCVGNKIDADFKGLRLTNCDEDAGKFGFRDLGNSTFNVILESGLRAKGDRCLVIEKLRNLGGANGPLGGAQVNIGYCTERSAEWIIDPITGEAASLYFKDETSDNRVCMTTGWPFLQVGAFLTPQGESAKTIVLLNEARQSANYAIQDEHEVLVTGMIPPRSIQTFTID